MIEGYRVRRVSVGPAESAEFMGQNMGQTRRLGGSSFCTSLVRQSQSLTPSGASAAAGPVPPSEWRTGYGFTGGRHSALVGIAQIWSSIWNGSAPEYRTAP